MNKNWLQTPCALVWALAMVVVLAGCPMDAPETAKMTLLVGTDEDYSGYDGVNTLSLTIDAVYFGDTSGVDHLVMDGPVELDLMDLNRVMEVLGTVDLPPGTYTSMALMFSGAGMTMAGDLEMTDLELDGHMVRVPVDLRVEAGGEGFAVFELGGFAVDGEKRSHKKVKPKCEVTFKKPHKKFRHPGKVTLLDVDHENGPMMEMKTRNRDLTVWLSDAVIFLPRERNTPTGAPADLVEGAMVFAFGKVKDDGSMDAEVVTVIAYPNNGPAPEEEPEGAGETEGGGEDEGGSEPEPVPGNFVGQVNDIGLTAGVFRLSTTDGDMNVLYADANVFLPGDNGVPSGAAEDLTNGQQVVVYGLPTADGIVAEFVRVLQVVDESHVMVRGEIDDVGMFVGDRPAMRMYPEGGGNIVIYVDVADVYHPEDTDVPTGSRSDLVDGMVVTVYGSWEFVNIIFDAVKIQL